MNLNQVCEWLSVRNDAYYTTSKQQRIWQAEYHHHAKHDLSGYAADCYRNLKYVLSHQADQLLRMVRCELVHNLPHVDSATMRSQVYASDTIHILATDTTGFCPGHPLAEPCDIGGFRVWNDALRYVHDLIGHVNRPNSFGSEGEDRAYQCHAMTLDTTCRWQRMALQALCGETRLQNSWVNYLPRHSHRPIASRPYAMQKCVIAPVPMLGLMSQGERTHIGRRMGYGKRTVYDVLRGEL